MEREMKSAGDSATTAATVVPSGTACFLRGGLRDYVSDDEVAEAAQLPTDALLHRMLWELGRLLKHRHRADALLGLAIKELPADSDSEDSEAILDTLLNFERCQTSYVTKFAAQVAVAAERLEACEAARAGRLA
jgi:hypothetical protein